MSTVAPTVDSSEAPRDQRLLLRDVEWSSYRKISEALTGRHVRLTYDRGSLEFMTISPSHGHLSRLLGRFVVVLTEEFAKPLRSFGDMTCNREDLARGLEPDECFYIEREPEIRDKVEIDLSIDPPPDLAIEIDLSHSSKSRLPIYAALGVGEVWRYDGTTLEIHRLQGTCYELSTDTVLFSGIAAVDLEGFLALRFGTDENSLVRAFRDWVRQRTAC